MDIAVVVVVALVAAGFLFAVTRKRVDPPKFRDGPPPMRPVRAGDNIVVEHGLVAHFHQDSGPSRPGIEWVVQIEGARGRNVIVRTYLSSADASEEERAALALQAAQFVETKLRDGWDPRSGDGFLVVPG